MISHDTELLAAVVNKVWFLDAVRGEVDVYNMDWPRYLEARATDEKRRRRERANAEKKAAVAAPAGGQDGREGDQGGRGEEHGAPRRPDARRAGAGARSATRWRASASPTRRRAGARRSPRRGCRRRYGSLEVFTGVDLAVDRGAKVVVLGLNGAGKTTLLRLLAGRGDPGHRRGVAGHGLRTGYFAQEHDTLDMDATVWENVRHAAPDAPEQQLRNLLGSFLFTGAQLDQRAGTLSGGERTRLALAGLVSSSANVLLLDEPTNNLDPASRAAGARRAAAVRGRGRARHPRPRRGRGAHAGQGHRAAGRHRGPVVGRLPRPRPAGLIGRSAGPSPPDRTLAV